MVNAYFKKIIFFISILLLSSFSFGANLQYYVNQATNQSLTSPYQYYNYQPSPLMDKAIESLPAYSNIKKCASNDITDGILILNPILFYNPQSTILYGDLNVKIYQARSKDQANPVLLFDEVTIGYYINEIYTDLLKKLILEMDSIKIDKNYTTNGSYCDLLSTMKESRFNLNY